MTVHLLHHDFHSKGRTVEEVLERRKQFAQATPAGRYALAQKWVADLNEDMKGSEK